MPKGLLSTVGPLASGIRCPYTDASNCQALLLISPQNLNPSPARLSVRRLRTALDIRFSWSLPL